LQKNNEKPDPMTVQIITNIPNYITKGNLKGKTKKGEMNRGNVNCVIDKKRGEGMDFKKIM
jgi:hypothetical protein